MCFHIEYTSNMAACYDNDVNDVNEPHVYVVDSKTFLIGTDNVFAVYAHQACA